MGSFRRRPGRADAEDVKCTLHVGAKHHLRKSFKL